jgi:RNA polymerase-binding transcription factor DksA
MSNVLDKTELNRIETQLSALCDELRREIEGERRDVADLARSRGEEFTSQHQSDVSADLFLQERALGTQEALKAELDAVEQALQRIAAGTYGECAECGATISIERLQARPQAIRCLACQQKLVGTHQ